MPTAAAPGRAPALVLLAAPAPGASAADRALSAKYSLIRASALAMLASPAALRIASKRARHASECLVPAAGLW
eukprot:9619791-Alexandrium_andersonii.AAC.1